MCFDLVVERDPLQNVRLVVECDGGSSGPLYDLQISSHQSTRRQGYHAVPAVRTIQEMNQGPRSFLAIRVDGP